MNSKKYDLSHIAAEEMSERQIKVLKDLEHLMNEKQTLKIEEEEDIFKDTMYSQNREIDIGDDYAYQLFDFIDQRGSVHTMFGLDIRKSIKEKIKKLRKLTNYKVDIKSIINDMLDRYKSFIDINEDRITVRYIFSIYETHLMLMSTNLSSTFAINAIGILAYAENRKKELGMSDKFEDLAKLEYVKFARELIDMTDKLTSRIYRGGEFFNGQFKRTISKTMMGLAIATINAIPSALQRVKKENREIKKYIESWVDFNFKILKTALITIDFNNDTCRIIDKVQKNRTIKRLKNKIKNETTEDN